MKAILAAIVFSISVLFAQGIALSAEKKFAPSSGSAAKSVKNARIKLGDTVKCAPVAEGEFKIPADATRALKKGSILYLKPGNYEKDLDIFTENVVIEGEPGQFCDVNLSITAKGCSIRNLWFRGLTCNLDITVVDSVFGNFESEEDCRADQVFDNCGIGSMTIFSYNKNIVLNKCTISNGGTALWLWGSKFTIENSIIYGRTNAFFFSSRNRVGLTMNDSIAYSDENLGANNDPKNSTKDFKDFKALCDFKKTGKALSDKPVFDSGPSANTIIRETLKSVGSGKNSYYHEFSYTGNVGLKDFLLKDDSPGKAEGYGVNLSADSFPVPY